MASITFAKNFEKIPSMKKLFLVLLLAGAAMSVSAQKYGHLNFGNLIALMPETKKADEQLKVLRDSLVAKGEVMAKAFQEKYIAALQEVQEGKLSPLQQQKMQEDLEKEQQNLANYEQEVGQKVQARREELLKPIIDKAEKAVADIAKENGYVLVFDTSVFNAILFAQDSDDLMPLLKVKLGLPDQPAAAAEKKQ